MPRRLNFTLLFLLPLIVACQKEPESPPSLQSSMMSNYAATAALFKYVWDPMEFSNPKNAKQIQRSLEILRKSVHQIEVTEGMPQQDPVTAITLAWFQDLLKDISNRFEDGETDYANWRLRSLTSACIACHSRHDTKATFLGETPMPLGDSVEYQFAAAQFLLATRQFNKASESYFQLARTMLETPSGEGFAIEALKEWLIVEVRVIAEYKKSADAIDSLLTKENITPRFADLLQSWKSDLLELANLKIVAGKELQSAYRLLQPVLNKTGLEDDTALVKTLKASALLHSYLEDEKVQRERKTATFLLALSYQHISIDSLSIYRKLYLEKCIKLFPQTTEAQHAYALYQQQVELDNTGSGGLHLSLGEQQKLGALREIAFGSPQLILPDSLDPDDY